MSRCQRSRTPRARVRNVQEHDGPSTLIIVDSHIAYGSPNKQDTSAAHGEPLGDEEVRLTKRSHGWPENAKFLVPDGVREHFEEAHAPAAPSGRSDSERYRSAPRPGRTVVLMQHRELPKGWDDGLPVFPADEKGVASRDSSSKVLNVLAQRTPWLLGGAADLAPSTVTRLTFDGAGDLNAENRGARNMHFGIREHAMGAVVNGLSLSVMRPFGSTFLIFSDYVRPRFDSSALMEVPAIYIFTHDSIGVGEDGPTISRSSSSHRCARFQG